jgi:hypothetical protein
MNLQLDVAIYYPAMSMGDDRKSCKICATDEESNTYVKASFHRSE